MPDIDLKRENIPFWAGGDGVLRVYLSAPDPTSKLPPDTGDLLSVGFNAGGTKPFSVGGADNVKLGIDAETSASLSPYWATSGDRLKALEPYGLMNYFDGGHADRLLLALALGGKAGADLGGEFKYSALTAETSLKAGADAAYVLVRSFPADMPAGELIADFFRGLRLPSDVNGPLAEDEVLIFEYGGYLNFAASVGAGYEISGSKAVSLGGKDDGVDIGGLAFVEKYGFSLMAKLGFTAGVAGRFRMEVRQGSEDGWARVVVRKSRNKSFSIAADVEAGASFESEGLPDVTADEFVGALVGLKSKNWLNLFSRVKDLTNFEELKAYADKLARSFIEEYTGKAFDSLGDSAEFVRAVSLIGRAAEQYRDAGDRAVTLFDKYFDAAANALDDKLTQALALIEKAESWADIKAAVRGKLGVDDLPVGVSDALWAAINQLTDGDQLNWMLGKAEIGGEMVDSLKALKERADKVAALAREGANEEIRRLVALARSKFPYGRFAEELAGLDAPKLKAMTDERLVGFVERLVGKSIDGLAASELGAAVTKFREVLAAVDGFKEKLFAKGGLVEQALNSSYKFKLHAEYRRASEDRALLDVELDLRSDKGLGLMRKAGRGDFLGVVEGYDAGVVKLNEGVLTHTATRETGLAVNVTGWHLNWNYQSLDRIITSTAQNFVPGPNGTLNVLTTVGLTKEKEVRRNRERVYTNMILRFVGESHGVLERNEEGNAFLVNALTGMESSYQLDYTDEETTREELERYLGFADDFGVTASDEEAVTAVAPYLNERGGSIGKAEVNYKATFTEDGLRALFTKQFSPVDERFLRETARRIVFANYMRQGSVHQTWAWCYWTDAFYNTWKKERENFRTGAKWSAAPKPMGDLKPPAKELVLLSSNRGTDVLNTLYSIEESLVNGMRALSITVRSGEKLDPREFEKRLADFGAALKKYDDFDEGDNTVFAMFDKLIERSAGGKPYRQSSLEVKITQDGKETTKVLVA